MVCVCHMTFCVLTLWQNRRQLGIGVRRQLVSKVSVCSVHPSFPPITARSLWGQQGGHGREKTRWRGPARVNERTGRKGPSGGSSTDALCTGFTLVQLVVHTWIHNDPIYFLNWLKLEDFNEQGANVTFLENLECFPYRFINHVFTNEDHYCTKIWRRKIVHLHLCQKLLCSKLKPLSCVLLYFDANIFKNSAINL
jgi:hypothetical protein